MTGVPGIEHYSAYCVQLDPRSGQKLLLHFKRDEEAQLWYRKILEQQRFSQNPITQYKTL